MRKKEITSLVLRLGVWLNIAFYIFNLWIYLGANSSDMTQKANRQIALNLQSLSRSLNQMSCESLLIDLRNKAKDENNLVARIGFFQKNGLGQMQYIEGSINQWSTNVGLGHVYEYNYSRLSKSDKVKKVLSYRIQNEVWDCGYVIEAIKTNSMIEDAIDFDNRGIFVLWKRILLDVFLTTYSGILVVLLVYLSMVSVFLDDLYANSFVKKPWWWGLVRRTAKFFAPVLTANFTSRLRARKSEFEIERTKSKLFPSHLPEKFQQAILRGDLKSGDYFKGVIVEGDLDKYSEVTNMDIKAKIGERIQESVRELNLKYGGMFIKFAGDNFWCVFDGPKAGRFALAFLRDFISDLTSENFGTDEAPLFFKAKGFMCGGEFQILRHMNNQFELTSKQIGYGEDVHQNFSRIKEHIKLRPEYRTKGNPILFSADLYDELSPLFVGEILSDVVTVKTPIPIPIRVGFDFAEFEFVKKRNLDYLKCFRRRADIEHLLSELVLEADPAKLKASVQLLSDIKTDSLNYQLLRKWKEAVIALQRRADQDKIIDQSYAQLLSCGSNLMGAETFSKFDFDFLFSLDNFQSKRANASVAKLLIESGNSEIVAKKADWFRAAAPEEYFRVEGEILRARCRFELDENILRQIMKMLESKDSLEQRTGIFVVHDMMTFVCGLRPSVLLEFENYSRLIDRLRSIKIHSSEERMLKLVREIYAMDGILSGIIN